MIQSYKYRLYPNKEQGRALNSLLETQRRLYNDALAARKAAYESGWRSIRLYDQTAGLTLLRRSDPFLAAANHTCCQRTLRRLDKAFVSFFRRVKQGGGKAGYPRFQGRNRYNSAEFKYGNGCRLLESGRVRIQGVGEVRAKVHRPCEGTVKTCVVKREADGWHVILTAEMSDANPSPSDNPAVGIDMGLSAFLVTSDGGVIAPPKFYRRAQAKLKRLQRRLSRKRKGGKNRRKAISKVGRLHLRVANQRRDFHHKAALGLVRRYGVIAHEGLNVKGIARSRLAKSIHDAGWSQFLFILSHKAECAGVTVIGVNPRNTTQRCSRCGGMPPARVTLRDRIYCCVHCGHTDCRDRNAAENILRLAVG